MFSFFPSWRKNLKAVPKRGRACAIRSCRPALEVLEHRLAPATFVEDFTSDTNPAVGGLATSGAALGIYSEIFQSSEIPHAQFVSTADLSFGGVGVSAPHALQISVSTSGSHNALYQMVQDSSPDPTTGVPAASLSVAGRGFVTFSGMNGSITRNVDSSTWISVSVTRDSLSDSNQPIGNIISVDVGAAGFVYIDDVTFALPPSATPQAVADSVPVSVATRQSGIFLPQNNDFDPNRGPLSVTVTTQPAYGTVVSVGAGFQYRLSSNYAFQPQVGQEFDSFEYTVSNQQGQTATGTVTLRFADHDGPPLVGASIYGDTHSIYNEDFSNDFDLSQLGYDQYDDEPDIISPDGSRFLSPDGLLILNDLPPLPSTSGIIGTGAFELSHLSANAPFSPPNTLVMYGTTSVSFYVPPAGSPGSYTFDEQVRSVAVNVRGAGTIQVEGTHGTATLPVNSSTFRAVIISHLHVLPDFSSLGPILRITLTTAGGTLEMDDVNFEIGPADPPPQALDDLVIVDQTHGSVDFAPLDNDFDFDNPTSSLAITSFMQPRFGAVTRLGDSLRYEMNPAFANTSGLVDQFTYEMRFEFGVTDSAIVTLRLGHPAVALEDTYTVPPGTIGPLFKAALEGVLANDHDEDGDALSAVVHRPPQNGVVVLQPDGSFTYTSNRPDGVVMGDSFTYDLVQSLFPAVEVLVRLEVVKFPADSLPDDVLGQFNALKHHGEAIGWTLPEADGAPDPDITDHYQGLARYPGAGTPLFYVTQKDEDDGDIPGGYLHVVRLGSRDTDGERLRSNLQQLGRDTVDTSPSLEDTWVRSIRFDGTWSVDGELLPSYVHPGSMAIVDDILFVPVDTPGVEGTPAPQGQIVLFDLAANGAEQPTAIQAIALNHGIDNLAVTRQNDGRYLIWVNGVGGSVMEFYTTNVTNLRADSLTLTLHYAWSPDWPGDYQGAGEDWPTDAGAHQSSTFIRQSDGTLFLIGMRHPLGLPFAGEDYADLYRVSGSGSGGAITLTRLATGHFFVTADGVGRYGNFAAADTAYVSPTGELILYSAPHDDEDGADPDFVRMGEFRHRDVNRAGSPLRTPGADAGGTYVVLPGGAVQLDGAAIPSSDRPWVELYDDQDFQDRSLVIDFDDQALLELNDFNTLDQFNDKTTSVRWRAPVGVDIYLYDDDHFQDRLVILKGTGYTETIANLGTQTVVPGVVEHPGKNPGEALDFNDKTSSLRFVGAPAPGSLNMDWDLDGDGVFGETGAAAARGDEIGTNPLYVAADLGEVTRIVTLRVTDGTGAAATATARVQAVPSDTDGVSDLVEAGAPNGGDGNHDGVPDRSQQHVTSLPAPIGTTAAGHYLTLVAPAGTHLVDVRLNPVPIPGLPPGSSAPFGAISFRLEGLSPGSAATVTLTLEGGSPLSGLFKYSPTFGLYNFAYDGATNTGAEFNGQTIVLHFVDGNVRGDNDGQPNGVLVDPGMLVYLAPTRIESVVLNDGSWQRKTINKITVTFSNEVALEPGAIELRSTAGKPVGQLNLSSSVIDGKTVAVLVPAGKPIANTKIQLLVHAARVHDIFRQVLDGNRDTVAGDDYVADISSQYVDQDGDRYTISLTGPGQAFVVIDDPDGDGHGPIRQISLQDTDSARTMLAITVTRDKQSNGRVTVHDVAGTGLKCFMAKAVDLVDGGINLTGYLGTLTIGDIQGGADITTAAGTAKQQTAFTAHLIDAGTVIDIRSPISTFRAAAMGAGQLSAPALVTLSIKGDARANIGGDFHADLTLTGPASAGKPVLGSAIITGTIADAQWNIAGDIGKLRVGGLASNWDFDVLGSIVQSATLGEVHQAQVMVSGQVKSFGATTFIDSFLFAGFLGIDPQSPLLDNTFTPTARVDRFEVFGQKGSMAPAFVNSIVAAATIDTVRLESIDTVIDGSLFGIVVDISISSVVVKSPAFAFDKTKPLPQLKGDFQINILQ